MPIHDRRCEGAPTPSFCAGHQWEVWLLCCPVFRRFRHTSPGHLLGPNWGDLIPHLVDASPTSMEIKQVGLGRSQPVSGGSRLKSVESQPGLGRNLDIVEHRLESSPLRIAARGAARITVCFGGT